ncbi:kynurenine formamidase [Hasllibacter halocynthiae]|uniref:Kynurenine formamidase n=1 Tax=Hasllibacter halocynthiae TaxID=595589 RepID=A0A2T0X8S9_9RHOB|nr:cyclase family protein [Hasllibacter halocynthiae]PRY95315.1 kynurenine formamidase [Hasllibacter halocynthiae]
MCDHCVIEGVKERMLSRRAMLGAGAAAAAALPLAGARPARAQAAAGTPVDMTHTLSAAFPTYFGTPGFAAERGASFETDGFNLLELTINEHTGTHIDAPLHFSADGASVDQIPVESLVCPLCVIDIAARAADDPDAQVTPDDVAAWTDANGPIPDGACVAMFSGWAEKAPADGFRNADAEGVMHFPGFHPDAAAMLLETGAAALAVDTLSLDHGPSTDFATHYLWLPAGRYGIECLAGLDRVPATGATLVVGAPKHEGGTGGPARVIALT